MYKKIMVFGMILLIMLCTLLPSFATTTPTYGFPPDSSFYAKNGYDYIKDYKSEYSYKIAYELRGNVNYACLTPDKYYLIKDSKDRTTISNNSINNFKYIAFGLNTEANEYFIDYLNSYAELFEPFDRILYANFNIYNADGSLYYAANDVVESIPFEAKILTPWHDDYKDNGKTFAFQGMFRLPSGVQRSDVKITGSVDDSKETYFISEQWREEFVTNTGSPNVKPYIFFKFGLTVYNYGIHTYKLSFEQVSTGKKLGEVTRRFEALEGFIDENGDGLDDRTNQPPYTPLDPPGTNPGTSPEWDGTILGFFQYLIDSVKYYVQNIVDGINVTMGAIGKVPQIMGTILNFPEPLTALLIFGVTCTIILAIFRR